MNDYEKLLTKMRKQKHQLRILLNKINEYKQGIKRLNNIINRTTKYVQSLSSKGRDCDIYEDIKQEILKELKGDSSNEWRWNN